MSKILPRIAKVTHIIIINNDAAAITACVYIDVHA